MLLNRLHYLLLECLIAKQSTIAFIISSYLPSLLIHNIQRTKHCNHVVKGFGCGAARCQDLRAPTLSCGEFRRSSAKVQGA